MFHYMTVKSLVVRTYCLDIALFILTLANAMLY